MSNNSDSNRDTNSDTDKNGTKHECIGSLVDKPNEPKM